jgi:hypothetical protein
VAVAEEQDIAIDGPQAHNDPVRAGANRRHRLAAWTAVAEQKPTRSLLTDVGGALTLLLAVFPLMQLGVNLGCIAEASQLARAAGPTQWANENLGKRPALEPLGQLQGVAFTLYEEREIRWSGMLTTDRPCCLTMPRQKYFRKRCVHESSLDAVSASSGD